MSRKEMEKQGREVLSYLTDDQLRFIVRLAMKLSYAKFGQREAVT